jgi:hypothetical protein
VGVATGEGVISTVGEGTTVAVAVGLGVDVGGIGEGVGGGIRRVGAGVHALAKIVSTTHTNNIDLFTMFSPLFWFCNIKLYALAESVALQHTFKT